MYTVKNLQQNYKKHKILLTLKAPTEKIEEATAVSSQCIQLGR